MQRSKQLVRMFRDARALEGKSRFPVLDLEEMDAEGRREEWEYELASLLINDIGAETGIAFVLPDEWVEASDVKDDLQRGFRWVLEEAIGQLRYSEYAEHSDELAKTLQKAWRRPKIETARAPRGREGVKLTVKPPLAELAREFLAPEVKGGYFWTASESKPVKPGFKVPPADLTSGRIPAHRREAEKVLERIRKEEFSGRPSRLTSIFVCPELRGFCEAEGTKNRGGIYEVSVQGKTFRTDGVIFADVAMAVMNEMDGFDFDPPGTVEKHARAYWRGTSGGEELAEVLVDGTVTVLRRVL